MDDDIAERRICIGCIGEKYLAARLTEGADEQTECDYCGRVGDTAPIDDLADWVSEAIERHYYRTSSEPEGIDYLAAKEGLWERPGEPVADLIAELAHIDNSPAQDVRAVLEERNENYDHDAAGEENPYDEEAQYKERPASDEALQAEWNRFEHALKTENRFFSQTARATLDSIFGRVDTLRRSDGKSVIATAGPETEYPRLFRARSFQSSRNLLEALKYPDREMGPPPARAAGAGRMNAMGISMFYGATESECALAEVRPPVGSKVLIGGFDLIRELRLLDIEAMLSIKVDGSLFDPQHLTRLEHAQFLERLSWRISQPVMPDDEPFDYLITQAIADYLATEVSPALDGVIYPAVQAGTGKNVALFHKAARVEALDLPAGTHVSARLFSPTEEGEEIDYSVVEEVPNGAPEAAPATQLDFADLLELSTYKPEDQRAITLRLDIKSLRVHHVQSVAFKAPAFTVDRGRVEKRDINAMFASASKRARKTDDPFDDLG